MLYHHAPNDDETGINTTPTKYMKVQHLSNGFDYSTITSSDYLDSITIPIYMFIMGYLLHSLNMSI